jgi:hypothetical protein
MSIECKGCNILETISDFFSALEQLKPYAGHATGGVGTNVDYRGRTKASSARHSADILVDVGIHKHKSRNPHVGN